ncbi:hypothetical protein FTUN_0751 [Frigoriglobus tundricola]|uniref:Uncharacterized protein n=1 Tax=Frigoriglobus tundricola TaxID=2774151 RepID=A0A6M5YIZ2_9BACT|nr:hypothetical protein FTUN_0751 [Frigoriglobus tundricola]
MVLDNAGNILQFELSSETANWEFLSRGQRRLQENYIRAGAGRITAVLLRHRKPEDGSQIKTVRDCVQFSVMWWAEGEVRTGDIHPGDKLVAFVLRWWAACEKKSAIQSQ